MTHPAGGLTCWVPEGDVDIERSLVDAGFESEYVDIQMRRETAAASPPADLPTGLTARALTGPRDREMHREAHDPICAAWSVDPHFDQFLDRFVCVDHYDPRLRQLVYDDEGPVGFVAGRVEHLPDATVGMVIHLDVAPHARRRGLGQVLLERICQRFSELGLSTAQLGVHDDNVSGAPAPYRSLGWVEISRRRKLSRPAS